MKHQYHIETIKIALTFIAIFLFHLNNSLAQKDVIELLPGTQKFSYDDASGAQKLIGGGVNLNYQGNKIYADSLYYYEKKKLVKAFGHVNVIKNDSLNLHCDYLEYRTDKRTAKLFGNVRVLNNNYLLTTHLLDYNAKNGLATYLNGGKIENLLGKEVLTSKRGYLYPENKNMEFSGKVSYISDSIQLHTDTLQYRYIDHLAHFFGETHIQQDSTFLFCKKGWFNTQKSEGVLEEDAHVFSQNKKLFGDSLYVDNTKGIVKGKKNIHFIDTLNNIEAFSQKAQFIKAEHIGYITDKALLIYKMKDDTIYTHSDSVFIYTDTNDQLSVSKLFHDVQIYGRQIQASCDSMIFNRKIGKATLFNEPILWSENAELKADTIYVYSNDSSITKAELVQKPTVVMEVDSGKYYNQIGGQRMIAFFANNKLIRAEVNKNAQTNYYPVDTIRTDSTINIQRKGMARLYASRIKVYLDSGEVIGVTYFDSPDGAFYPIPQIPKDEQFIKNFSFNPKWRPKSKEDIFLEKRKYR